MQVPGSAAQHRGRRGTSEGGERWDAIRVRRMFQDWIPKTNRNSSLRSVGWKERLGGHSDQAENFAVRSVKRNAFPASYLKAKPETRVCPNTRSSKACRISHLQLIRKQSLRLKNAAGISNENQYLRRPRSQRKRDWDVVINTLVGKQSCPPYLQDPRDIYKPILPYGFHPKSVPDIHLSIELWSRVLMKPAADVVVASVTSNLLFDLEFLSRLLTQAESITQDSRYQSQASLTRSCQSLGFLRPFTRRDVFGCAEQKLWMSAVMLYGPLEKPSVPGRALEQQGWGKRMSELLGMSTHSTQSKDSNFVEPGSTTLGRELYGFIDLPRVSLEQMTQSFSLKLPRDEPPQISTGSEHQVSLEPEEISFCPEQFCGNYQFETLIVQKGFLSSARDMDTPYNFSARGLSLEERNIPSEQWEIADILPLHKPRRYSLETGFWCSGPLEVLRKSQNVMRWLLHPVTGNAPELLKLSAATPYCLIQRSREVVKFAVLPEDTLIGLRKLVRQKKIPSKKWKKFAQAVQEDSQEENAADQKIRMDVIRDSVNAYDPPKRRQLPVCAEIIQSVYQCTQNTNTRRDQSEASKAVPADPRRLESDESAVDIIFSDEELETDRALGVLLQMQAAEQQEGQTESVRKQHSRRGEDELPLNAAQGEKLENAEQRRDDAEPPLCAPADLVCPAWSLALAEHCLHKLKRGCVFLPPPLSILPTLATVVHSFLAQPYSDNRIMIMCCGGSGAMMQISSFLDFALAGRFSTDVIRRTDTNGSLGLAPLAQSIASIVITDSIDAAPSQQFRLLVIVGPGAPPSSSSNAGVGISQSALQQSVSHWVGTPYILVMPHHPYNDVQEYSTTAVRLGDALNARDALVVQERDDIDHSLLLARPDLLFLVPSRSVFELLAVLETWASSYMPTYQMFRNEQVGMQDSSDLRDVHLPSLEAEIVNAQSEGRKVAAEALEIVHSLRQARSFALCDGFETATDYLTQCGKRASSNVCGAIEAILEDVEVINATSQRNAAKVHPMTQALQKSMAEMEEDMLEHSPSLRRIHGRQCFKALIVTNAKESYNGVVRGIEKATNMLEASDDDIAVCEVRHIWDQNGKKVTGYNAEGAAKLEKFSHVYHVLDDRDRESCDSMLPPQLMQYVYAGRTRLLTISVDERREQEFAWKKNEALYRKIALSIWNSSGMQRKADDAYYNSFMVRVSLDDISRALEDIRSSEESKNKGGVDGVCAGIGVETVRKRRRGVAPISPRSTSRNDMMRLSGVDVRNISVHGLREVLRERLKALGRDMAKKLRVCLTVGEKEECTPAATFLFRALTGDESLRERVIVEIVF